MKHERAILPPASTAIATGDLAGVRVVQKKPWLLEVWEPLDWLIVGGESGPGARPFDIRWARNAIAQCKAAGVPCFVKQLGAKPWDSTGAEIDHLFDHCGHACECCDACPSGGALGGRDRDDHPQIIKLKDKKGGDWNEWPSDLRVREFPEARA